VKDVRGKHVINIKMEKTDTTVEVYFNTVLQQEIAKYTSNMADSDWLLLGRQGDKPITRQMAHTFLHKAAQDCGIDSENWGTHSMRKTFGYQYYKKMKDVYYLMKLMGMRLNPNRRKI